jgi:hypothetical protein
LSRAADVYSKSRGHARVVAASESQSSHSQTTTPTRLAPTRRSVVTIDEIEHTRLLSCCHCEKSFFDHCSLIYSHSRSRIALGALPAASRPSAVARRQTRRPLQMAVNIVSNRARAGIRHNIGQEIFISESVRYKCRPYRSAARSLMQRSWSVISR